MNDLSNLDYIDAYFANRARVWGNAVLYPLSMTSEVLQKCREVKVLILGIEAFAIIENKRKPLMDYIEDWSNIKGDQWADKVEKSICLSESYFNDVNEADDLFFEFVFQSLWLASFGFLF